MIRYNLRCKSDHEFEGWFGSSDDYEDQLKTGLLICPECGSKKIEKAIMAPSVRSSRKAEKMAEIASAIRQEIASNCDDVGDGFADEARAMFYGEKPTKGIYGKTTPKEAKALADEGIPALPLPDVFHPKRAKDKLN